jgi:hypothetical protein
MNFETNTGRKIADPSASQIAAELASLSGGDSFAILSRDDIGVLVIPDQVAVGEAHKAFGPDGNLGDEKRRASVEGLGESVAKLLHWNRCPEPFASQLSSAACRPFEKVG